MTDLFKYYKNGEFCPHCKRWGKVYQRKISYGLIRVLCHMRWVAETKQQDGDWIRISKYVPIFKEAYKVNEYSKLRFWNLLESQTYGRKGLWRVTKKGFMFLDRKITIPENVYIFDTETIKFGGNQVSFTDIVNSFDQWINFVNTKESYL